MYLILTPKQHDDLTAQVKEINAAHWAEDYNASILRDSNLLSALGRRSQELFAQWPSGSVCSCECGPCGKFGLKVTAIRGGEVTTGSQTFTEHSERYGPFFLAKCKSYKTAVHGSNHVALLDWNESDFTFKVRYAFSKETFRVHVTDLTNFCL